MSDENEAPEEVEEDQEGDEPENVVLEVQDGVLGGGSNLGE